MYQGRPQRCNAAQTGLNITPVSPTPLILYTVTLGDCGLSSLEFSPLIGAGLNFLREGYNAVSSGKNISTEQG
jgi:hypothetical protein